MSCCQHEAGLDPGFDTAFTVDASRITFGRGCIGEVGDRAAALGMRRVALFTDPSVARLELSESSVPNSGSEGSSGPTGPNGSLGSSGTVSTSVGGVHAGQRRAGGSVV